MMGWKSGVKINKNLNIRTLLVNFSASVLQHLLIFKFLTFNNYNYYLILIKLFKVTKIVLH